MTGHSKKGSIRPVTAASCGAVPRNRMRSGRPPLSCPAGGLPQKVLPYMGAHSARLKRSFWVCMGLTACVLASCQGCDLRPDIIGASNTLIDFGLNDTPYPLYVWNTHEQIASLEIEAKASERWLELSPASVTSGRARDDEYDKRSIIVRVNRILLDKGDHVAHIELSSPGIRPRQIEVRAHMDRDGRLPMLNIFDPVTLYSRPYLLDFVFAMRDANNNAVVAEPAQFDIAAFESAEPAPANETGLALRTAPNRRLNMDIVLDYSLSMQETFDAVTRMEDIVRNEILHRLPADAAAGITLYYREDLPPLVLADLTTEHAHLREQLAGIRETHVGRYTSGAIMYDALAVALDKFAAGNTLRESRHIFLLTDGYDTSSRTTPEQVINRARNLFVKINVVGIGDEPNLTRLLQLTGRTGGLYFSAVNELDRIGPYMNRMRQNLAGQYRLRWATMRRRDQAFTPSFHIEFAGQRAVFTAPQTYNPTRYAGDILQGMLRAMPIDDVGRSRILVVADYIPRFVKDLRLYIEATHPFEVYVPDAAEGGLLGLWGGDIHELDPLRMWLDFYSYAEALPFAGYGPLFTLEFGEATPGIRPVVTTLNVDNSLYEDGVRFGVHIE